MFGEQMPGHGNESKMLSPRNKTGEEKLLLFSGRRPIHAKIFTFFET
jgi:hypothetical protein